MVPAEKVWLIASGGRKVSDDNVDESVSVPFPIEYGPAEEIDGNIVVDYFSKSWLKQNPSARVLLVEANPSSVHDITRSSFLGRRYRLSGEPPRASNANSKHEQTRKEKI